MRVRITSSKVPVPSIRQVASYHYLANPSIVVTSDPSMDVGPVSWHDENMSDVVTPQFRRRRDSGEIIINPMISARSDVTCQAAFSGTFTIEYYHNVTGQRFVASQDTVSVSAVGPHRHFPGYTSLAARVQGIGSSGVLGSFGPATIDSIQSQVLARASARAADSDALALVTIAELSKTADMLGQFATRTAQMCKSLEQAPSAVRGQMTSFLKFYSLRYPKASLAQWRSFLRRHVKGSPRKSAQAFIALTGQWLLYRYGVMATYYDLVSWVDAHNSVGSSRRARYVSELSDSYDSGLIQSVLDTTWTMNYTQRRLKRVSRISSGVIVGIDLDVSHIESLGALNILSSGWELVPFSFVIDWFADVSTRLAAVEGKILRPVLGSWTVSRHLLSEYNSFERVAKPPADDGVSRRSCVVSQYTHLNDVCELVTRIANPQLSVMPQLRVNLNWKRIVDSAALLSQSSQRLRKLRVH